MIPAKSLIQLLLIAQLLIAALTAVQAKDSYVADGGFMQPGANYVQHLDGNKRMLRSRRGVLKGALIGAVAGGAIAAISKHRGK
uniref:Uncharacterized protein n=1 Tax=Ditylenchus dipsaci TaxID=166011 RepID=A0A915DNB7_9BILA